MKQLCKCHYNLVQKRFNKIDHIIALLNHLGMFFQKQKYSYLTFYSNSTHKGYSTTITRTKLFYKYRLGTSLDLIRFIKKNYLRK